VLGEQPVNTRPARRRRRSATASLGRSHKPSAGHRPLSALRGEIDQISLSSVLTVLEMERKNGILMVEHVREVGRLFLRRGRIIRAAIEEPALSGAGRGLSDADLGRRVVRLPGRRRRRRRRDPGVDDISADGRCAPGWTRRRRPAKPRATTQENKF
jgi:hypothetical protein